MSASRAAARHNARLPADAGVLNFWPMRPQPRTPIYEILARLRLRIAFDPRLDQPTIAWDGYTWLSPQAARRLPRNAINARCVDISKTRVEQTWESVSGYPLAVDPTVTTGPLVMKSNENARFGGRIVVGPVSRRRGGLVYERLIDCRDGDEVVQLRVVVMAGDLVVAYEKRRPYPMWFTGTRITLPRPLEWLFSSAEQALLIRFAAAMDMDYGELDVLRDRDSRLIYVVDANRTPGRPHHLAGEHHDAVYTAQAEGFRELLKAWSA